MPVLDREESIEQAYFFHAFRERVLDGMPAQEVLARIGEELLSTTKLPLAISFMLSEIKVAGLIGPAMARLGHYFTPFQTFVIGKAEEDVGRFSMDQALLILEREAKYKADGPDPAGLFVYQFEAIARNRLGYGGWHWWLPHLCLLPPRCAGGHATSATRRLPGDRGRGSRCRRGQGRRGAVPGADDHLHARATGRRRLDRPGPGERPACRSGVVIGAEPPVTRRSPHGVRGSCGD